jgi:hypothetical protein
MDACKKFEKLRFVRTKNHENVTNALEYVKKFIMKHNLVIKGGISMDLAMRKNGSKLYSDSSIPDYDFYSPDHAKHGYLLGQELCNNGFKGIKVVGAIHVTTIKVMMKSVTLADISYLPQKMFNNMRTEEHNSLTYVHPHFTMLDQFSSLSNPFDDPPREVIFNRWDKDRRRLLMLLEYYPFPKSLIETQSEMVTIPPMDGIINGWAALAYYNTQTTNLSKKYKTKLNKDKYTIPGPIVFMTDDWKSIIEKVKKSATPKFFNKTSDFPRHAKVNNYVVFDTVGRMPTILQVGDRTYASLTTLAWYFLYRIVLKDDHDFSGINNVMELIDLDMWKITTETYGRTVFNDSMVFGERNIIDKNMTRKPKNKYLDDDCDTSKEKFDPSQSELFKIDGSECLAFEPVLKHEFP